MASIIEALSNAPLSVQIMLGAFVLIVVIIAIPLVRILVKKIEQMGSISGPGGVKIDLNAQDEKKILATIKIDKQSYDLVLDSVETMIKDYLAKTNALSSNTYDEYVIRRERCIQNAVNGIRLMYHQSSDRDEDLKIDDNFLNLYLQVEFGDVLRHELVNVYKNPALASFSEVDESDELKRIIDVCNTKMELTLNKYSMLSNKHLMKNLIKQTSQQVRDEVYMAVKFFVKLTKKEQEQVLKIHEDQLMNMEKKLIMILGPHQE